MAAFFLAIGAYVACLRDASAGALVRGRPFCSPHLEFRLPNPRNEDIAWIDSCSSNIKTRWRVAVAGKTRRPGRRLLGKPEIVPELERRLSCSYHGQPDAAFCSAR